MIFEYSIQLSDNSTLVSHDKIVNRIINKELKCSRVSGTAFSKLISLKTKKSLKRFRNNLNIKRLNRKLTGIGLGKLKFNYS